jgi:uncharacterized membrane protein YtjA (UPF0391 family)
MLSWVVTFLIIALIAGILGFGGLAGASIEIAKVIFFVAVVLFLVSAVVGLARDALASSRKPWQPGVKNQRCRAWDQGKQPRGDARRPLLRPEGGNLMIGSLMHVAFLFGIAIDQSEPPELLNHPFGVNTCWRE